MIYTQNQMQSSRMSNGKNIPVKNQYFDCYGFNMETPVVCLF